MNYMMPQMMPQGLDTNKHSGSKKALKKLYKAKKGYKKLKKFKKKFAEYQAHAVDQPIENPFTMKIPEPYVGKPSKTPEEVLMDVLTGIEPKFDPSANLMEQGFTSLNLMQIVTRCAEQGYRVQLQDLIMDPVFDGIVVHMIPGDD